MEAAKYSIQLLTQSKIFKEGNQSDLTGNSTSKIIVIYCIWWWNVSSIKMAWLENNRNNSKWKQKDTQFNYLLKLRYLRKVISPISLGIVPVRLLLSIAFGGEMWEVSKWHCEKTIDVTVNGSRQILN